MAQRAAETVVQLGLLGPNLQIAGSSEPVEVQKARRERDEIYEKLNGLKTPSEEYRRLHRRFLEVFANWRSVRDMAILKGEIEGSTVRQQLIAHLRWTCARADGTPEPFGLGEVVLVPTLAPNSKFKSKRKLKGLPPVETTLVHTLTWRSLRFSEENLWRKLEEVRREDLGSCDGVRIELDGVLYEHLTIDRFNEDGKWCGYSSAWRQCGQAHWPFWNN